MMRNHVNNMFNNKNSSRSYLCITVVICFFIPKLTVIEAFTSSSSLSSSSSRNGNTNDIRTRRWSSNKSFVSSRRCRQHYDHYLDVGVSKSSIINSRLLKTSNNRNKGQRQQQRHHHHHNQMMMSSNNGDNNSDNDNDDKDDVRIPSTYNSHSDTDENNKNNEEGLLLTPYQILYPSMFTSSASTSNSGIERELPLHECIKLLRQSLQRIVNSDDDDVISDLLTSSPNRFIRIEHQISHTVDPLGWLHAQTHRRQTSANNNLQKNDEPILYYANAEGTLETSVYGSAYTYKNALASSSASQDSDIWHGIISKLPESSRLYGGERFDSSENSSSDDNEWKEFHNGMWILPLIELRIEQVDSGETITTIAVHLNCNSGNSKRDKNLLSLQCWKEQAQITLKKLEHITDQISDSSPPTTLPPIISRDYFYNKGSGQKTNEIVDGQEIFEQGVTNALDLFENNNNTIIIDDDDDDDSISKLEKVVLARRMDINFSPYAKLSGLDIIRRWKYSGINNEGGHLLCLYPGSSDYSSISSSSTTTTKRSEFFGCTPERLFSVKNNKVISEALAGTRPRGSSQEEDEVLLKDLFTSTKDQSENQITYKFISNVFKELEQNGLLVETKSKTTEKGDSNNNSSNNNNGESGEAAAAAAGSNNNNGIFVRRLRHLQHICQRLEGTLKQTTSSNTNNNVNIDVSRQLLQKLHPTPAVCGYPKANALQFIRDNEANVGFDRGYYSGPFGSIGKDSADIVVAIRSGLLSTTSTNSDGNDDDDSGDAPTTSSTTTSTKISIFAGAGIVPGSTVQGEWVETSYKLGVISSLFMPSPITLQSLPTPNVAWATAFVEELIRCGVTQYYVCPGSRSTPLVGAIVKASRTHVGIVNAISIHDERSAAFRAVGYGRGSTNHQPAAVITSSGTAIGNLYPAIMEAGMDGIPLLVLTADRPYENRNTGANQAIDQVHAYSSTYVRWFRDIAPPNDDVPVSVALSDANHAVQMSRSLRGPVHVNIQFRENLAPDTGPIRNDNRIDSLTKYNGFRFTDVPGFQRWSVGGGQWQYGTSFSSSNNGGGSAFHNAVSEVVNLILQSKRGLIVVGNIRSSTDDLNNKDETQISDIISNFAQKIGFPIMAGVQSGNLRFRSSAVIPYAEHLLKHPTISQNIQPDLVLQIGSPLISTEIPNMIMKTMNTREQQQQGTTCNHVLVHPHHTSERADPNFTVSHKISADVGSFVKAVMSQLDAVMGGRGPSGSNLAPLVLLGRSLRNKMPDIIHAASKSVVSRSMTTMTRGDIPSLTEPQTVLALSEVMSDNNDSPMSLFLSNSMPVRDAEFFLYPTNEDKKTAEALSVGKVGVNRGASGIDGIISTASGFSEAAEMPTTLLVGDVAALHDINALHSLSTSKPSTHSSTHRTPSLTTVVVNNDGGGIFSFLPVANHANDFSFDEYFGTPTNSFSFEKGVDAFGLNFKKSFTYENFKQTYQEALESDLPCVVEANVVGREGNVAVHKEITSRAVDFLSRELGYDIEETPKSVQTKLPMKLFATDNVGTDRKDYDQRSEQKEKVLLLLHGWMGDKSEWDSVGTSLVQSMPPGWTIIAVDLPGHGDSPSYRSSQRHSVRSALGLSPNGQGSNSEIDDDLSIDGLASSVLRSLSADHKLEAIDAVAGYSLGGRVALAMRRLSKQSTDRNDSVPNLIRDDTKLILLSSYPGEIRSPTISRSNEISDDQADVLMSRMAKDDALARQLVATCNSACLFPASQSEDSLMWSGFLEKWYGASLWGDLQNDKSRLYRQLISRRKEALVRRGRDFASVLKYASPSRHSVMDWKDVEPRNTLFVAGSLDEKYSQLGIQWSMGPDSISYHEIDGVGHALLVEASAEVADVVSSFLYDKEAVQNEAESTILQSKLIQNLLNTDAQPRVRTEEQDLNPDRQVHEILSENEPTYLGDVGSMDLELFQIDLVSEDRKAKGVFGIGWGASARQDKRADGRSGFILNIVSRDGSAVGIGESSPLPGLHSETLDDAKAQLSIIKDRLEGFDSDVVPKFNAKSILAMDKELTKYIDKLMHALDVQDIYHSVRSGLEMALLSLAAQVVKTPILQAMADASPDSAIDSTTVTINKRLPLNGLITRGEGRVRNTLDKAKTINYPSLKVKVGHQIAKKDALAISTALDEAEERHGEKVCRVRADANRAWNMNDAKSFVTALDRHGVRDVARWEFVEEPLRRQGGSGGWSLDLQVENLKQWYELSGIPFALDESIADLAEVHGYDYDAMEKNIRRVFSSNDKHGCAAFVLKPALLGLETSMRLARLAHKELGIGAVFSSSFDSGVGLAYTAILGAASDASRFASDDTKYAHGAGTFDVLNSDTLAPSFGSYVDNQGMLNVLSLSRALYGLGLDEIRETFVTQPPEEDMKIPLETVLGQQNEDYQSSAATSSSGREISVVVSLSLPFSDEIASSRFTDLPQQSRWSPWLTSVAYLDAGQETEWTLNVRGVRLSWRAVSTVLEQPYRGIKWESISGLKNIGIVEFIPTTEESCVMKVKMTIITPRVISALFQGTSVFIEDFLQNKLLKWSLEMFRDVVKGDLALQRGDVELGDALFGAVEGRANAIEATLSYPASAKAEGYGDGNETPQ